MCPWVHTPRASQGPGHGLFLCSLFTIWRVLQQVWEQSAVPAQGTDLAQLLPQFLPSNGPLLGIPQVPPLEMKLQNTGRLWRKTNHIKRGSRKIFPKLFILRNWKAFRGEERWCSCSVLSHLLNLLRLAAANAAGLMDLWFDFIASWYFYSLKDTLALKMHPWSPVLAQQKIVSAVSNWRSCTFIVHFLLSSLFVLYLLASVEATDSLWLWNSTHPVHELVSFNSKCVKL